MNLRLKFIEEGEFYTDYELISRNVIISPLRTRIFKIGEPILHVRQIRFPQRLNCRWIDLDNKVPSADTYERFLKNVLRFLSITE